MPDPQIVIWQTRKWLETVIIAQTFCPFAKREFDNGSIHYAVIETSDVERRLHRLIEHCIALDRDIERETTLLIFPDSLSEFDAYLDMLELANLLLKDQGYEGIYQLASFHPHYRFDGVAEDDPSQYTNRSPYPMLHILREASVEQAVKSHPDPENIPTQNIRRAQKLGLQAMEDMLEACYK